MSPTTRAARTDALPRRDRGTGPLPTDSRGARLHVTAIPVPRPAAVVRTPRESWTDLRATHGSEDAGGASPEAPWQGPAGTPGFRWQDPGMARATSPNRGPEASGTRLGGPA